MKLQLLFPRLISWLFGLVTLCLGLIDTFWGNDPGYGIFLLLLSLIYFPPGSNIIRYKLGFGISLMVRIFLAFFILWSALGVAELCDKIDLVLQDI